MSQETAARLRGARSRTDQPAGVRKVVIARNDRRRRNARLYKAAKDYNASVNAAAVVHDGGVVGLASATTGRKRISPAQPRCRRGDAHVLALRVTGAWTREDQDVLWWSRRVSEGRRLGSPTGNETLSGSAVRFGCR